MRCAVRGPFRADGVPSPHEELKTHNAEVRWQGVGCHGLRFALLTTGKVTTDGYWAEWAIVEFLAGQVGMGA